MKRIVIHWTAGTNKPNATDLQHYHFVIDSEGKVYEGKFPVSANEVCRNDSKGKPLYSAHTGGGNTGSIGVSMCGMAGFKNVNNVGNYPLTRIQCEKCFSLCAELCKKYNIAITSSNVLTHFEFGKAHPNTSSFGKIDIIYLPPYPDVTRGQIGDFIRNKIRWYSQHHN
jgi:N-acetyl-anhydromuramyl-L-alanine amidase AmpD